MQCSIQHMTTSAKARPLRIVHVVDSLEPGGLERVTADLALAQQRSGHQVSVFSLQSTQGFKPELIAANIPVIEGNKSRSLDLHLLKTLRRWVLHQNADIVHAHNFVPNYHAALALLALPRGHRPAQVCTVHDMGTRLQQRKLRWLFLSSLMRTQAVAMVGQRVHERFTSSGWVPASKAQTVLNGLPVERFNFPPEQRQRARQALSLPPNALVIGCVGRLVPLKCHARMIEVFPALQQQFANLHMVIIGDGPLRTDLQAQIDGLGLGEHISLAGHHPQVASLLPALDVFALPSQTEGLSIALLEACASGLAIVATRVGGNPEIIHDGDTGLLIPPDDNASLSQALVRLLASSKERTSLGQKARAWVHAHASDAALLTAYNHCYSDALQRLQT